MTYPQQPGPQQPQAPQQPAYQAPYGAPQAPQAPQQPAGYQYPQGYPQQPGYPQQSGYAPQPQGPSFLDTMNVRAVTKISAILMVVFIGIETFLSFLRLVDAGNNMSGFGYKFLFGSTPWLMLTAILAVWVIGLNVVQHGPQWFKMAAFVAMVAAAGLRVLAWLIYLFSGNFRILRLRLLGRCRHRDCVDWLLRAARPACSGDCSARRLAAAAGVRACA